MGMPARIRSLNEILYPRHLFQGPTHIVLGVNNFCNLKCLMCDVGTDSKETNFGGNLMGSKTRSMPLSLFHRIVDQMVDFCPKAHLAFAFTEPLAWAPMGAALQYARKKGIDTSVTTNGMLLPKRAKELSGLCANVSVSLDGPEPIHDRIRRRSGSYARAVRGIEELASLDTQVRIGVFCTITEWNAAHLVEFLTTMSALPIHRVGLTHNNFVTVSTQHFTPRHPTSSAPTRRRLLSTLCRANWTRYRDRSIHSRSVSSRMSSNLRRSRSTIVRPRPRLASAVATPIAS
jgi:MoaA/NifB/PqqE/SkfB family radical SAM enzyme